MANTKPIYFKRTFVPGRRPNVDDSANSSFIGVGELAFNLADQKAFTSNGSALLELGSNLQTLTVESIVANGSSGSDDYVLKVKNDRVFWGPDLGTHGYTGSRGANGAIGFHGSRGLQGQSGFTGSKGDTGFVGSRGELGFTGSRGMQGQSGFHGSQGLDGFTGSQGLDGYTGSQGLQGLRGSDGFTGSQGLDGYTGSEGQIGFSGSRGLQGLQGDSGYTGSHGALGFSGSKGERGFTGSQGLRGIQGASGFTGSEGQQGEIGYTGSKGDKGDLGSIGPIGSRGFTGSQGSDGISGDIGFTGSRGLQGIPGYSGSQGEQGIIGYTGSIGYSGSRGIQGFKGFTGSQGLQGIFGFTGSTGYSGSQGYAGSQGIEGYTGSVGYAGSRGYSGSVGFTGSIGYSGSVGEQGLQGFSGSQGETGFTGSRGFTGSQGDSGYTGSQGIQGIIGYTGSLGGIGFTGSRGILGFTGSYGDIGFTGSIGDLGYSGSVGYTGSLGGIGFTGSQGILGYSGSIGYSGSVGPAPDEDFEISILTANTVLDETLYNKMLQIDSSNNVYLTLPADAPEGATIIVDQVDTGYAVFNPGPGASLLDNGFNTTYGINSMLSGYVRTNSDGVSAVWVLAAQRPLGYTGSMGPQGPIGYYGSIGGTGYSGSIGYTGSQGDKGEDGTSVKILGSFDEPTELPGWPDSYLGDAGDGYIVDGNLYIWNGLEWQDLGLIQGPVGYSGSQGFTGSQGIQGIIGYSGSVGDQGIIGYSGSVGGQGLRGFTGSQGYSGSQGDVGFTGSQGIQGIQGVLGYSGSRGFTGSQGIQGVTGYSGSQGIQGIQGVIGYTGSIGIQGTTGYTGSFGTQGVRGFTGSQGYSGSQGDSVFTVSGTSIYPDTNLNMALGGNTIPAGIRLNIVGGFTLNNLNRQIFGPYTSATDHGPWISYTSGNDSLDIVSGYNHTSNGLGTGGICFGVGSGATWSRRARIDNTTLRAEQNNVMDLGTTDQRWKMGYINNITLSPGASATPATNGDVVFERSDTEVRIKQRGSDNTVRYVSLPVLTAGSTALIAQNNLSDITNSSTARTNLGLGTLAQQNANAANIWGGVLSNLAIQASNIVNDTGTIAVDSPGFRGRPVLYTPGSDLTLNLSHAGKTIYSAGGSNFIIPPDATADFPIGSMVYLGAGTTGVSILRGAGVALRAFGTNMDVPIPAYRSLAIQKLASNIWQLAEDPGYYRYLWVTSAASRDLGLDDHMVALNYNVTNDRATLVVKNNTNVPYFVGFEVEVGVHSTSAEVLITSESGVTLTALGRSGDFLLGFGEIVKLRYMGGNSWRVMGADNAIRPNRIRTSGASTTAAQSDRAGVVEMTSASATTFTIPADASVLLPVGTDIELVQMGAGQVTIAPAAGVTINSADGLKIRAQYGGCVLRKRAANNWIAWGALTT